MRCVVGSRGWMSVQVLTLVFQRGGQKCSVYSLLMSLWALVHGAGLWFFNMFVEDSLCLTVGLLNTAPLGVQSGADQLRGI